VAARHQAPAAMSARRVDGCERTVAAETPSPGSAPGCPGNLPPPRGLLPPAAPAGSERSVGPRPDVYFRDARFIPRHGRRDRARAAARSDEKERPNARVAGLR
jgi:hypothetical protein